MSYEDDRGRYYDDYDRGRYEDDRGRYEDDRGHYDYDDRGRYDYHERFRPPQYDQVGAHGGHGHRKCCPHVVDPLGFVALLAAIPVVTFFLNMQITMFIGKKKRKRKKRQVFRSELKSFMVDYAENEFLLEKGKKNFFRTMEKIFHLWTHFSPPVGTCCFSLFAKIGKVCFFGPTVTMFFQSKCPQMVKEKKSVSIWPSPSEHCLKKRHDSSIEQTQEDLRLFGLDDPTQIPKP